MQRLLSAYVLYFNHRHRRGGHLFRRPFKSEPIKDERQLAVAVAYVGDNPVRAGICPDAGDYRWSSHGTGDDAHRASLMYRNTRSDRPLIWGTGRAICSAMLRIASRASLDI